MPREGEPVIELSLETPDGYPADHVLDFFGARAVAGVEVVEAPGYLRTLALPHGEAIVGTIPRPGGIACRLDLSHDGDRDEAVARCRHALDLDADPRVIDGHLAADPILRPLVERAPGIRVPGAFDPTEAAVRAVLGQQVSVKGARTLAARLVARCGGRLVRPRAGLTHTFPTAAAIAQADLSGLGMPGSRMRALAGLATALAGNGVSVEPGSDPVTTHEALVSLTGIGEWTASYICMRALKDPDAFPAGDLGVVKGAAALGLPTSRRALVEASERWRPWRAYAVMHLWSAAR